MRVHIDPAKCEGFGPCADAAPEIFQLDEWGYAMTLNDGVVPQGLEEAAQRAVDACPVGAISIQGD
jgi:ferredoxin